MIHFHGNNVTRTKKIGNVGTVWKIKNFSVTEILRENNCDESKVS